MALAQRRDQRSLARAQRALLRRESSAEVMEDGELEGSQGDLLAKLSGLDNLESSHLSLQSNHSDAGEMEPGKGRGGAASPRVHTPQPRPMPAQPEVQSSEQERKSQLAREVLLELSMLDEESYDQALRVAVADTASQTYPLLHLGRALVADAKEDMASAVQSPASAATHQEDMALASLFLLVLSLQGKVPHSLSGWDRVSDRALVKRVTKVQGLGEEVRRRLCSSTRASFRCRAELLRLVVRLPPERLSWQRFQTLLAASVQDVDPVPPTDTNAASPQPTPVPQRVVTPEKPTPQDGGGTAQMGTPSGSSAGEDEVHLPRSIIRTDWSPKTLSFIGDLTVAQSAASETARLLAAERRSESQRLHDLDMSFLTNDSDEAPRELTAADFDVELSQFEPPGYLDTSFDISHITTCKEPMKDRDDPPRRCLHERGLPLSSGPNEATPITMHARPPRQFGASPEPLLHYSGAATPRQEVTDLGAKQTPTMPEPSPVGKRVPLSNVRSQVVNNNQESGSPQGQRLGDSGTQTTPKPPPGSPLAQAQPSKEEAPRAELPQEGSDPHLPTRTSAAGAAITGSRATPSPRAGLSSWSAAKLADLVRALGPADDYARVANAILHCGLDGHTLQAEYGVLDQPSAMPHLPPTTTVRIDQLLEDLGVGDIPNGDTNGIIKCKLRLCLSHPLSIPTTEAPPPLVLMHPLHRAEEDVAATNLTVGATPPSVLPPPSGQSSGGIETRRRNGGGGGAVNLDKLLRLIPMATTAEANARQASSGRDRAEEGAGRAGVRRSA
uniref:Uncharacterized protein n=2 Tax=Rhizochromulina marina TaxID=1034831 RepID=A0A7S2RYC5_9STRA|mmetsp:Transcript_22716/g.66130  ORF Transcript_22716/g.66130 Transcript_22716/m.66130 type:complete len:785 (+) Transcript_22716:299-2653(+)